MLQQLLAVSVADVVATAALIGGGQTWLRLLPGREEWLTRGVSGQCRGEGFLVLCCDVRKKNMSKGLGSAENSSFSEEMMGLYSTSETDMKLKEGEVPAWLALLSSRVFSAAAILIEIVSDMERESSRGEGFFRVHYPHHILL